MATPLQLHNAGTLYKYDPELPAKQAEIRKFYASKRMQQWVTNELPKLESTWKIEQSPQEQLSELLDDIYCPGEPLTFDRQFKPLRYIEDGIWELKTADLRVFGWFFAKDCFVASAANQTNIIKQLHLYIPYGQEAIRLRNQLDLNSPKFVPGDDPNAVVSNFTYP
jgi:hypothetical protein